MPKNENKSVDYIEDVVEEITFNVDDMTGEEISFATEVISKNGANEVYTTPIYMKKNRPGILFTVICSKEKKDKILETIFRHTSTIGLRCNEIKTYRMEKEVEVKKTKYGQIHNKVSNSKNTHKEKFEFDDLKKIANKNNLTIRDLISELNKK